MHLSLKNISIYLYVIYFSQDLSVLVKALSAADGLVTHLDLSYNCISDDGLASLCHYLKVWRVIGGREGGGERLNIYIFSGSAYGCSVLYTHLYIGFLHERY